MQRNLTESESAFLQKQLLTIIKIARNNNMRSDVSRIRQMELLATLALDVLEVPVLDIVEE